MAGINKSFEDLIGNTPLVELTKIAGKHGLNARLVAKLEFFNPAGSAKDRIALSMILDAEASGKISQGSILIEPTSGNTGIGIAAVCASKGYRAILTMPETMSIERRKLLSAYGAEIVLTDGALGLNGAIEKANELAETMPNAIVLSQFGNPANPKAHRETTGPEIWEGTDGMVDIFVAGIGTGGTITGVGEYLKSMKKEVKIIGVEPSDSPVLTEKRSGSHGIQGIGAGFVPENLNSEVLDEVIAVSLGDSYEAARDLAAAEGLLAGISSGAALWAAVRIAKREENRGKMVLALLPDTGERYLSTDLFG
ncbi:MAG: cysteine synthase A [Eubacteriaceae bacterium]|jgi:cysteine synthase A|nr:cysteine synthase A [Eubacteriaceae bacterium]